MHDIRQSLQLSNRYQCLDFEGILNIFDESPTIIVTELVVWCYDCSCGPNFWKHWRKQKDICMQKVVRECCQRRKVCDQSGGNRKTFVVYNIILNEHYNLVFKRPKTQFDDFQFQNFWIFQISTNRYIWSVNNEVSGKMISNIAHFQIISKFEFILCVYTCVSPILINPSFTFGITILNK